MKRLLFSTLFFTAFLVNAQTPCSGGFAAGFPCDDFDLQANFTASQLSASSGNDSWGWTDPQDGVEYAIVALTNGTAFFNLSDPTDPIYLGKLPTFTDPSTWRDVKVYENHAFIVSEASNHGMQVFDLTRLRGVTSQQNWTEDAHYSGFGRAHNIAINEDTGFAYAIGTTTFNGGPHFVDISNPTNPVAAGGYSNDGYSHDAQIITYNGPDPDHIGKELFFGSNEDRVVIVDVTNKANPQNIATIFYPSIAYTHQGWLTDDNRYFFLGDEIDELNFGFDSRTIIFDVEDLDNPTVHMELLGETGAIDHNGYVKGNFYFLANYHAGLQVYDISDIDNFNIERVGFFDTFIPDNGQGFGGSWNVYPFFDSGNIVISGTSGFTLVKSQNPIFSTDDIDGDTIAVYPNPVQDRLTINSQNTLINTLSVTNMLGQVLFNQEGIDDERFVLDTSSYSPGVYIVSINDNTIRKVVKQ